MKKNPVTLEDAIAKLKNQIHKSFKNDEYEKALSSIQQLNLLCSIKNDYKKNTYQSPTYEIEYNAVQCLKKHKHLTFDKLKKEIKNNSDFTPNFEDQVRYNSNNAPRWVAKLSSILNIYKNRGWAKYSQLGREWKKGIWSLTPKGKKELKKDGYF
tara:strand:- start:99 stop:563 length:465 start_codon:yes stop_codon:yes gene_type:complete